jgi:uncharacterized membrane protein
MPKRTLAAAAVSSLIGLSLGLQSARAADDENAQKRPPKEKCYGIAKKAQNDCSGPGHDCSGEAKTDGDKAEWLWVPKGTCLKIVGGSLTPGQ